ncbi:MULTISPECIES: nucleotide sugar dehydrogenase [Legionella]|uniref:Nucleotide sugar dehydrogenase n=1 Tax=Legionella septentrionalis TaxID=2498109 RepID=A0A433JK62_9GAMM|nr:MULTISPECIES: nucleotide sugar dehydrogenase [Legionella]MCP0914339.1 nucleotide sugar dehydrogenase [Legionella sp. 27cVA30]RUQ89000.1 nucleotide sugar dehydrogenase [Legionella septentrionalis]RUR00307.1 nucleotide sugar dehydrogenase [Legionella septentrionalis]RUR11836.1 nucleotide sugar dehydrogenase [Legionella septentrionalis]RUR17523.1 nucleotide sugar dehydrogenase [Legionella septentrionalis]
MLDSFVKKINNKEAIIGIVGLGYVGLPLMLRFAEVGYRVIGIDIDEKKNALLNQGKSYIQHIPSADVAKVKNRIHATSDFAESKEADALILCVPTPLDKYREPDLSYVLQTTDALLPHIRAGQLISLESTTYPGTTEEELKPRIESTGLIVGQDVFLVYSPEREDPGNAHYTTASIPKVCGGQTAHCLQAGVALYSAVIDKVVPASSTKVAEMTKLLENIHRSVNIGLVNEMKILADKMDIDIYEVIDAAATKPFGFVPYYPGPGIGGHCIPIDPFYLTWKAREYGLHTRFIELAGEINSSMPHWVVNKVSDALNARERAIKNSKILVLGIAYKRDVDDMRESPSIEIMELLQAKGAEVSYSDPHVPVFPAMRAHHFDLHSVEINAEMLAHHDCVLLATAHRAFDYELIARHARLIVDTRGAFKQFKQNNIVSA